jgi:hypothetical protein
MVSDGMGCMIEGRQVLQPTCRSARLLAAFNCRMTLGPYETTAVMVSSMPSLELACFASCHSLASHCSTSLKECRRGSYDVGLGWVGWGGQIQETESEAESFYA